VLEIVKHRAGQGAQERSRPQVRVLGIDEIALKKGHKHYALILSDLERHCLVAVLPDREQKTLAAWLDQLTPAEQRAIRVVSMDMWQPYYQVVRDKLAQAMIVADRFHVMRQLNDRLTQARRAIQGRADETTRTVLKGSRWLLVKN
jgi:transposase